MELPEPHHNVEAHRWELPLGGDTAVVTYNPVQGGVLITETLVPVAHEGKGVASALARAVLDDARARGLRVLPVCPFFAAYIKRHPETHDLVDPGYKAVLGI